MPPRRGYECDVVSVAITSETYLGTNRFPILFRRTAQGPVVVVVAAVVVVVAAVVVVVAAVVVVVAGVVVVVVPGAAVVVVPGTVVVVGVGSGFGFL